MVLIQTLNLHQLEGIVESPPTLPVSTIRKKKKTPMLLTTLPYGKNRKRQKQQTPSLRCQLGITTCITSLQPPFCRLLPTSHICSLDRRLNRGEGKAEAKEFCTKGDMIFIGKSIKTISLFLYILPQVPIRLML